MAIIDEAPVSPKRLILLVLLVLLAIMAVVAAFRMAQVTPPPARSASATGRLPSPLMRTTPPPTVEPLVLLETTPDRARAINAAIPFSRAPLLPAAPFRFAGTPGDREKALICLAAATWWEAGDDPVGQRAVAQVVLNRMRHPAYPKSVCGVVFQGSERRTGCQFTFTCDGALQRVPSAVAWQRARAIAEKALEGSVDRSVGTATNYHTDWVVPYWSASLEKIASVHTHLFFRWRGGWGKPAAFTGRHQGSERLDPRLLYLADPAVPLEQETADGMIAPLPPTGAPAPTAPREEIQVAGVPSRTLKGNIVRLAAENPGGGAEYGLELDAGAYPASYVTVALALCKGKPACIVTGWIRRQQVPLALPIPLPAVRTASFLYRKNATVGREQAYWNCRQFARGDVGQCLPGTEADGPAKPS